MEIFNDSLEIGPKFQEATQISSSLFSKRQSYDL
jgi:hypothetical protein